VQQKLPRGIRAATLAAAALAVAAACLPARAAETAVKIDNFSFAPERITVKAGTTITWVNEDDIPHTVASSAKLFKSKALDTDDKYSFTFTTPGTYQYFCSLHPHMTGTVVVEVESGSNGADGPSLASPMARAAPEQRPR
jgi:amicyanin